MQRIQIQTMILGAKAPRMQHATTRLAVGIRRIKTSAAMPGERVISWDVPDANHREDEECKTCNLLCVPPRPLAFFRFARPGGIGLS